jgi:hypothetical protein
VSRTSNFVVIVVVVVVHRSLLGASPSSNFVSAQQRMRVMFDVGLACDMVRTVLVDSTVPVPGT